MLLIGDITYVRSICSGLLTLIRVTVGRLQHPWYDSGRTQLLAVKATSMTTKSGKQSTANAVHRHKDVGFSHLRAPTRPVARP